MTNPGQRNCLVDLQRVVRSVNAAGERSESWYTYATEWAQIKANAGRESERQGTFVETGTVNITIPYYPGVTSLDRVKFGDLYFYIQGVDNVGGLNEEIILTASEVT